jgi:hypothetical protein
MSALHPSMLNPPPPNLLSDIEYVATKVPMNKLVMCYAPSLVAEQDTQDIGSCLIEPDVEKEVEPSFRNRYAWLERSLSNVEIRKRYQAFLERLRRKKDINI